MSAPELPTKEGYTFLYWQKGDVEFDFNTIITEDITLVAKWKINEYTVTFKNWDGSILEEKQIEYGKMPTYTGVTPIKLADKTYTYTFATWDKEINPVTGNVEYIAQYDKEYIEYKVTFKFENGEEDFVRTYHYGDEVVIPENPIKPSDGIYTYTFTGWHAEETNVDENIVYIALYDKEYIEYTVTFKLENGEEDIVRTYHYGDIVEVPANPSKVSDKTYTYKFADWDKEIVAVESDATYTAKYDATYIDYVVTFVLGNGQADVVKTYHYGDKIEAPADPSKDANKIYKYTFTGWDKEVDTVEGHTTYTAMYKQEYVEYTITFRFGNGEKDFVKTYHYGDIVEVPANPNKDANETFTYTFKDWGKEVVPVDSDATYIAQYTREYVNYTITFVLGNGEEDIVLTYHYGDTVQEPAKPIKAKTAEYTYTFEDWDKEITKVRGNATYTAQYTATKNKYTITFLNWDGSILEEKQVEYGVVPTYTGANPSKAADEIYRYTFAGWDKEIGKVEGDTTYEAKYDATYIEYIVRFVLGNGEADVVKTYHYGDTVVVPEKPIKASDKTYTYEFARWDKEIVAVNGNITYTAMYKQEYIEYTVTFKFGNGTEDFVKTYHYGDTVVVPANPIKASDKTYTYEFARWDKEIVAVNGNITYTAMYKQEYIEYIITFVLGNGEADIVKTYHYGDTVQVPANPSKAADETYTYAFKDWDKEIVVVNGDATYTAQYNKEYIDYIVTFKFGNGEEDFVRTYHYGDIVVFPENPAKPSDDVYTYTFTGWHTEETSVEENIVYIADYDKEYIEYTVTFKFENGEEDFVKTYHYGDTVEIPADPSKAATVEYTYKFADWDKEIVAVEGDATYTAQYDATYIEYTVTFKFGNGTEDFVKTYHYGDIVEIPENPSKNANETFTYTFKDWGKEIVAVEGDATYIAQYTREYVNYTITFVLGNGEEDIVLTYHYGDTVQAPANPSKAATAEYTYEFADWDKEITKVRGNATYTATYTATKNKYTVTFLNWDGSILEEKEVEYGVTPTYTGAAPTKAADKIYRYTFAGWDKAIGKVEGDATYEAKYDATFIDYTVTFVLGNGQADVVATYNYGDTVQVPANPSKAADKTYIYAFKDWDKEIVVVNGDATYTAQYDKEYIDYTVTFVLGNGEANVVKTYHYGDKIEAPANPSKAADKTYTYTFVGWDKPIDVVGGNTIYTAKYDATYIEYTITFVLGNGETDVVKTYHYGDTVQVPANPSKAADETYTYAFKDWDKEIVAVDGDATYTAQYDKEYIDYTVTFVLGNGQADVVATYHYGDTVQVPANPSKAVDEIYRYTFAGWDKAIGKVEGNVTYTAQYDKEYIEYTVTFKFGNGEEDFVKTYHYGDTVEIPADPSKAATVEYTYKFADWDKEIVAVDGDATYTAQYDKEYIEYTVTFKFGNGEEDFVKTYHYGDTVEVPADPSKAANETFTYTFKDWGKEIVAVNGDATYIAQYTREYVNYTITFVLGNGEEDIVKTYHYGDTVAVPSNPSKAATAEYTYAFADWDKEITKVRGNATYTATYTATKNKYTITFVNWDGSILEEKEVEYGVTPTYTGAAPTKAADEIYRYTFAGWDKAISKVEGDATYESKYDATYIDYTVTFVLGNGQADVVATYHYGDTVQVPANPSKAADEIYRYTFAGWDKAIAKVEGNTTYTAQYDATYIEYTITFVLGNGEADIVKTYHYGDTVVIPANPTKPSTVIHKYTFTGWDKVIGAVHGNTTYTAMYKQEYVEYTITFVLGNGEADIVKTYHYGDTVQVPANPSKATDKTYTYAFKDWDKEIVAVDGDATYTAQYDKEYIDYTVTFVLGNGQADVVATYHYGDTVQVPANPSKAADEIYRYTFAGWDKAIGKVDGDVTYTAQYDKEYIDYTVTFVLGNGEADIVATYHYGDTVEVPANPSKAADETYTYAFKDWDKEIVAVAGDTTYTAQYDKEYIDYTVTFVLGNGQADIVATYHYGDTVEVPVNPSKAADKTYTYTFAGWDKAVDAVAGDTTYTAQYDKEYIDYTITFVLGNGEADIVKTYHYGDAVEAPVDPKKVATVEYTYTFAGWDKAVDKVEGNTTYTAQYTATKNKYTITFKNWDGSILEEKLVEYGTIPTYTGATPTKLGNEVYKHDFVGWDRQLTNVTGQAEYIAQFEQNYVEYTITFVLGNGEADFVKTYHYGDTVEVPANPTKATTAEYTYTFAGWDKPIVVVSGDTMYTAQYTATKNKYEVRIYDSNGNLLKTEIAEYGTQLKDLVALTEDGTWVEEYQGHELTDIITGHTDLVVVDTAEIKQIDNVLETQLGNVDNSNMTASFNEEEDLISVDFKNKDKSVSQMLDDTVAILETLANSDESYESIVLSYPGATDLDLKQLNYDKLGYWNFILKGEDATKLARFIARVGKNSGSGSHALGVTTTELATRTAATPIHVTVTLKDGYVNEDGSNTIEYDLIFTAPSE